MKLCGFDVGLDRPFFLIAGPCHGEFEFLFEIISEFKFTNQIAVNHTGGISAKKWVGGKSFAGHD